MTQPTLMLTEYEPAPGDVIRKNGVQLLVDDCRGVEVYFRRWDDSAMPAYCQMRRDAFAAQMLAEQPTISRAPLILNPK